MKKLYIQCNMGAAGDMLAAALTELLDDSDQFIHKMNNIGIPKVKFVLEKSVKCGITGSRLRVFVDGEEEHDNCINSKHEHIHHHSSLEEIYEVINSLDVSLKVKENVKNIYAIIAEAESAVHCKSVNDIHFHEVGTYDAIADITAVCVLVDMLSVDKIICSDICVGNGTVKCAHGILPVPAPATAYILRGIPIYGGEIQSELCTPTGAAILKYFANEYGNMPLMNVEKIGYGMGKKDFEMSANCVRVLLGSGSKDCKSYTGFCNKDLRQKDFVVELCCNLDDMTAEAVAFAEECLAEAGALDVYTVSSNMKKNRSGIILCCLCMVCDKEKMLDIIFKHTSTLGIRQYVCERAVLNRTINEVETSYGNVMVKKSFGYGVEKKKAEYEDVKKIAKNNDISIQQVLEDIYR